ncbi:MAG: Fe2+/Zn2+ uptake regulation protein [Acidimicrobiaceae bacterium]|nr:Fe2+/Zn2+ uptake regulation protein [Acidimicrobiaceae bacterium]
MANTEAHGLLDDLHDLVETRLRRVDQRYTAGRRAIIDLIVTAGNPVSIADIATRLPDLPRSSAYRNLVDLESAGLVRRIVGHDEFARFELAEDLTEHHHHLLCVACGKVIDITLAAGLERNVSEAIEEIASVEGFRPHGHRLDVLGVCGACA